MANWNTPIKLDKDRQLWEQQSTESGTYYGWFIVFRDMGRVRTLTKVAKEVDKGHAWISNLSARFSWFKRAEAWDQEEDRLHEEWMRDERRKTAATFSKIADAALVQVARYLQSADGTRLKAADATRMMEAAAKVKRLAVGEPERVALTGPDGGPLQIEIDDLGAREARLKQLAEEVLRRSGKEAA